MYTMPDGSKALYYERAAFVAFDIFLLKRPDAEKDYTADEIEKAKQRLADMSDDEKNTLFKNVLLGLPGSKERFSPDQIMAALKTYSGIDRIKLKEHLFYFLQQVVPIAEECGLQMAWPV